MLINSILFYLRIFEKQYDMLVELLNSDLLVYLYNNELLG